MIRNVRAVAIDDEKDHLDAIFDAAIRADILCRRLHHPHDKPEDISGELINHPIQLVICDLYLQADGASGGETSAYSTIGSILERLGIQPWSPYVLLLWSKDSGNAELVKGLKEYLEKRGAPQYLPCAIIPLDKIKYGIPGTPTAEQITALWGDLQTKVSESRGVKLLMQWEAELHRAAGQVTRNLIATIRQGGNRKIDVDDEIDTLLSRVAVSATSKDFAQEHPRIAAVEGLLPLVSDQYQHQQLSESERAIWDGGLHQAKTKATQKPLSMAQAAALNSALHIALDDSIKSPERGTVFEATNEVVAAQFAIGDFAAVFGLEGKWSADNLRLRLIQIEGACDAAQRKKGVVPLVLAAEVDAGVNLRPKGKGFPESVEETPIFMDVHDNSNPKKLLANVRYFFTLDRSKLSELKPVYRLRESLVAKLAFAWANHSIRPGIVFFGHDGVSETAATDLEDGDVKKRPHANLTVFRKIGAAIIGVFQRNK